MIAQTQSGAAHACSLGRTRATVGHKAGLCDLPDFALWVSLQRRGQRLPHNETLLDFGSPRSRHFQIFENCDMLLVGSFLKAWFSLSFTFSCSGAASSSLLWCWGQNCRAVSKHSDWLGVSRSVQCELYCALCAFWISLCAAAGSSPRWSTIAAECRQRAACAHAGTLLAHAHARAALTSTHIQLPWTQLHTHTHALRSGCRRHCRRPVLCCSPPAVTAAHSDYQ